MDDVSFTITSRPEKVTFFGFSRYSKRVFSSQTTPLLTLAAVYENPSTVPLLRPNSLGRDEREGRYTHTRNIHTRANWDRLYGARRF